jgi:hypothetical protein
MRETRGPDLGWTSMMTRRTTGLTIVLAMACGPERISHGDGGASDTSGDPTATDDGSSGNADTSTGDAPPTVVPGEGPYGAGTRLKPVVERTAEGVTQLLHWYDRELGIDCEFVRDSVGTPRCLPLDVEGVTVGFTAQDCAEPALGAQACADVPTRVRGQVPGAADCNEGARHQAYLRGAPIGSGDMGAFSAFQGECRGGLHPERYALTPIADEEFVAATVVEEPRGSVLVRALVADDGAFLRERLVDPRTGTVCLLGASSVQGDDAWVCHLPSTMARGFADEACSNSLVAIPDDGTCEQPTLQAFAGAETWRAVGEAWEGPMFSTAYGGVCEPLTPLSFDTYSYHRLGEEIPPIESPRFVRATADDPGRLRRRGVMGDDEFLVLPGIVGDDSRWFDALLEQGCQAAPDDEGTLRCFPLPFASPYSLAKWGDPACSETPLLDAVTSETTFSRITRMDYGDCGAVAVESLQNVVGPWDGPVYGPSDDGSEPCVLQEVEEYDRFFQLGNHVQLDDAPVLELVTDG